MNRKRELILDMIQAFKEAGVDEEDLKMAYDYGATTGVPGLVYYNETVPIYEKNTRLIWALVNELADECGYRDPVTFIGVTHQVTIYDHTDLANYMVWMVAEVCGSYIAGEW